MNETEKYSGEIEDKSRELLSRIDSLLYDWESEIPEKRTDSASGRKAKVRAAWFQGIIFIGREMQDLKLMSKDASDQFDAFSEYFIHDRKSLRGEPLTTRDEIDWGDRILELLKAEINEQFNLSS